MAFLVFKNNLFSWNENIGIYYPAYHYFPPRLFKNTIYYSAQIIANKNLNNNLR